MVFRTRSFIQLQNLSGHERSKKPSFATQILDTFMSCWRLSQFVVTVLIKMKMLKLLSHLHHGINKFAPPTYLDIDGGSECNTTNMEQLCTLLGLRRSLRTPYSPWTNGFLEVQNKNVGTHLRMFLLNTYKD